MISRTARTIASVVVSTALCGGTAAAPAKLAPQDPARVAEIKSMLRAEAGFPKTRFENRAFWDKIAATGKPAAAYLDESRGRASEEIDASNVRKVANETVGLALAECIENEGAFLPAIEARLDALSALGSWANPYHDRGGRDARGEIHTIELSNGAIARNVAVAQDALRGRLSPEVRARAVAALRRLCLDTYLAIARDPAAAHANNCWWIDAESNWNGACNCYMAWTALLVLDDAQERAEALELAERSTKFFLSSYSADGLCLEGASYWWYGFGEYMRLALVARQATGSFLEFVPPFAKKAYLSSYGSLYADDTGPAFGDCDIGDVYTKEMHLGSLIWPEFDRFGAKDARFLIFDNAQDFMLRGGEGEFDDPKAFLAKNKKPFDYPLRSWYPADAGQLVTRPGASKAGAIYAAIKGGAIERPHGHRDAGSYSIAVDGLEVMCDPGNTKYDNNTFGPKRYENPMRNSFGHPVPRVDGHLQSGGGVARAEVVKSYFSDERDYVVYDLKGVYAEATNLVSLTRALDYRRSAGRVIVTDKVAFDGAGRFETALIALGGIEDLGGGVYRFTDNSRKVAAKCTIRAKGAAWHVERETIPVASRSKKLKPHTKPLRFAIVFDEPVREATVSVMWELDAVY